MSGQGLPVGRGRRIVRTLLLGLLVILLACAIAAVSFVWLQAKRTSSVRPDYVALGSSFAAGAGLGPLQPSSPLLCARSVNGYPQQLARMRGLSIVDKSCGGAVTKHLLSGGQFFQGPQIDAITAETRLVTITVGGNDIGYIGDLSLLAERRAHSFTGWIVRHVWSGAKRPEARAYDRLRATLAETLAAVRRRAPRARIVVATYPTILPPSGTCARLGIGAADAEAMRQVGDRLASITRSVAMAGGALLVDMHSLGAAHHACSADPWTAGWTNASIAPFHPTLAGAKATAAAISHAIDEAGTAPAGRATKP